jgi:hypothetical protein
LAHKKTPVKKTGVSNSFLFAEKLLAHRVVCSCLSALSTFFSHCRVVAVNSSVRCASYDVQRSGYEYESQKDFFHGLSPFKGC